MCAYHKYVLVPVNVGGQRLELFLGGGAWWQPQLCWIVGEKELTRRELMSDMTPLSRRTAGRLGVAADWVCLCVCVWLSGKWRQRDGARKWATTTVKLDICCQEPNTFSTANANFSQHRPCPWNTSWDGHVTGLSWRLSQSCPGLSKLHLPRFLFPYHVPFFDLLALC